MCGKYLCQFFSFLPCCCKCKVIKIIYSFDCNIFTDVFNQEKDTYSGKIEKNDSSFLKHRNQTKCKKNRRTRKLSIVDSALFIVLCCRIRKKQKVKKCKKRLQNNVKTFKMLDRHQKLNNLIRLAQKYTELLCRQLCNMQEGIVVTFWAIFY